MSILLVEHAKEAADEGALPVRALAAPVFIEAAQHNAGNAEIQTDTIVPASSMSMSTNFRFPPLEPLAALTLSKYCGPTPESNWVIPGLLLVGAYPASQSDEETTELLGGILRCGVRKFVCLQLEYVSEVTEAAWRSGAALRPYFQDAQRLAGAAVPLSFAHVPIVDCGITDDSKVLRLAEALAGDLAAGQVVYLHCWGGHGRTGTVVSILLHLLYGLSAADAMRRCQAVHDLRRCPVDVGSPQTQPQRDQVARVLAQLQRVGKNPNPSPNPGSIMPNKVLAGRSASMDASSKRKPQAEGEADKSKKGAHHLSRLSFNAFYDSLRGNHHSTSSNSTSSNSKNQLSLSRLPASTSSAVGNVVVEHLTTLAPPSSSGCTPKEVQGGGKESQARTPEGVRVVPHAPAAPQPMSSSPSHLRHLRIVSTPEEVPKQQAEVETEEVQMEEVVSAAAAAAGEAEGARLVPVPPSSSSSGKSHHPRAKA